MFELHFQELFRMAYLPVVLPRLCEETDCWQPSRQSPKETGMAGGLPWAMGFITPRTSISRDLRVHCASHAVVESCIVRHILPTNFN